MLSNEFNMEDAIAVWLEEGREEGLEQGREEGLEQGREEGREEGLEQGREEGIRLIIEKMRQNGMCDSEIASLTGLTLEEPEAKK